MLVSDCVTLDIHVSWRLLLLPGRDADLTHALGTSPVVSSLTERIGKTECFTFRLSDLAWGSRDISLLPVSSQEEDS